MRKLLTFAVLSVVAFAAAQAERTVTFSFADEQWLTDVGIAVPASGEGTNLDNEFVYDGITFAQTKGTTATRLWNTDGNITLRAYRNGTLTFSGATIYKIVVSANTPANLSTTVGTYSGGTWTGSAEEVTFNVDANIQISTVTLTVDNGVPTPGVPKFSPAAGTVTRGTVVTISCVDADKIYYTTDGTTPTNASMRYTAPITINEDVTIKAIGYASDNATTGSVATATYTIIPTPEAPIFTPASGAVPKGSAVTITCANANYIYYTTDGTNPTNASTRYTAPITINEAVTVKAIGYGADNVTYGNVATAYYTLTDDGHTADDYLLVTDPATLAAGDKIIIVNTSYSVALATTQNTNNRAAAAVTIVDNVATVGNDVDIITLEGQAGAWNLKTASGYLYAASSASNWLRTESAPDADGNATADISLDDNGVLNIIFQGTNTRNNLLYNSSSNGGNIFSCYNATSNAVKNVDIYRQFSGTPQVEAVDVTGLAEMNAQPEGTLVRLLLPDNETQATRVLHAQDNDIYVRDLDGTAAVFTGLTPNKPIVYNQHLLGYITGTTGRTDNGLPTLDCSAAVTNTALLVIADPVTEPNVEPTPIALNDYDNHLADWVAVADLTLDGTYTLTNQFNVSPWSNPFEGAVVDLNAIVAGNRNFFPLAIGGVDPVTYVVSTNGFTTPQNDLTNVNIRLERPLRADVWTTIVLPFDLDEFSGKAMQFVDLVTDEADADIMVFEEVSTLQAGVPYVVMPDEDIDELNFYDVTFSSAAPQTVTLPQVAGAPKRLRGGETYSFVGTYTPVTLPTNGTAKVINDAGIATDATDANNNVDATTAYIIGPAGKNVTLQLGNESTDVITTLADNQRQPDATYNVLGQKMHSPVSQLPAGVYIVNGQKVVKQ